MSNLTKNNYKDYTKISLKDEINKKINGLKKTRENRIELGKRLSKYAGHWKFLFLTLNIEAVIFVILALSGHNNAFVTEDEFNTISGIFSIYVILLQYYINDLNYSERSLKMEYHQLEIEDQLLKLKELMMELNRNGEETNEKITKYQLILSNYQLTLKNNENHKSLDRKMSIYRKEETKKIIQIKEIKMSKWFNRKKVKWGKAKKVKDKTIDNVTIYINYVMVIFVFIFIGVGAIWK